MYLPTATYHYLPLPMLLTLTYIILLTYFYLSLPICCTSTYAYLYAYLYTYSLYCLLTYPYLDISPIYLF